MSILTDEEKYEILSIRNVSLPNIFPLGKVWEILEDQDDIKWILENYKFAQFIIKIKNAPIIEYEFIDLLCIDNKSIGGIDLPKQGKLSIDPKIAHIISYRVNLDKWLDITIKYYKWPTIYANNPNRSESLSSFNLTPIPQLGSSSGINDPHALSWNMDMIIPDSYKFILIK
ncbi:MAG: hypothetical protein M0R17_01000 [Candidatus Omnitrophica bacterium]|jgi:hypothetical protein|nr:hypothetical protein [Candidatus Omnitrophota bacterium]